MSYIFVFISALTLYAIVLFMPKRLSFAEMYYTSYFAILFNVLVDVYLDFRLDLYGYFNKGPDYQMVFVLVGIFPPISIIYLNGFPYDKKLFLKLLYIFIWLVIAIIYDYLSLKCGLLYYKNWSLLYSALCYPPILIITALNLRLIRWLTQKH
ncbi:MAG: CBO0543 family protein [Heyndrickxia sp.]